METYFKIVDYEKGKLKTLFHGVNGSRTIEKGRWLKADVKTVHDGSSGTEYESGWHILPTYDECKDYLKKFKHLKKKKIIKCKAKNIRPKTHSRDNVYLSEYLYVEEVL